MGIQDHQVSEVQNTTRVFEAAANELAKLRKHRQDLFDIENAISMYADRVDIENYALISQIHRVISWVQSGKYAKVTK